MTEQNLLETTFARLEKHIQNKDVAFISACRANQTAEENNKATDKLEHDLKCMSYGFIKVKGGYIEDHDGVKVPVEEKTFAVINNNKADTPYVVHTKRNFLRDMVLLANKYDQQEVLIKLKNEPARYYDKSANITKEFKGISKENIEDYYTRLRNTRFKFIEADENEVNENYWYKSQGYSTKVLGCLLFDELRKKYPSLFKKYPSD